jgi:hypothetical protein
MKPPHLNPALQADRPWRRLLISTALVLAGASTAVLTPATEQPETPPVQALSTVATPAP